MTQQELSDTIIESLALSVKLLEKFEIMNENNLLVMKAKQSLKTTINHLEIYVNKLTKASDGEEEHFNTAIGIILEIGGRLDKALKAENVTGISERKKILKECVEDTVLFPKQKVELYEKIRDSGILDY